MSDEKSRINRKKKLLFKISRKVTKEEFKQLKFFCDGHIAMGELENITDVLDLFKKISQLDDTGDHGVGFIAEILNEIERPDLANQLLEIEDDNTKAPKQNLDRKILLEVEKMVAADWKMLGRHLDLERYTLDEIDVDNRTSRDKCEKVLQKWAKRDGMDMENLKQKLFEMRRRDVVNMIEKLQGEGKEEKGEDLLFPVQAQDTEMAGAQVSQPVLNEDDPMNIAVAGQGRIRSVQNTAVLQPPTKPSGASASKYNINVHPGSNVMVGDCGQMTIYSNARFDDATIEILKQKALNAEDIAKLVANKEQTQISRK